MTVTTSISAGRADGSVGTPQLVYVGKVDGTPGRVVAIFQGNAAGVAKQIYSDASPPAPPPPPPPQATIVASPASQGQTVSYSPGTTYSYSATGAATGGTGGDPFSNKKWSASDGGSGTGWSGHVTIKPTAQTAGSQHYYNGSITFTGTDGGTGSNQSGTGTVQVTVNY